jgi:hypothetical protein
MLELKMAAPSEEKLICDKFNLEALTVKMHQRKVFYKDAQVCPDPLTNMAATGNFCF